MAPVTIEYGQPRWERFPEGFEAWLVTRYEDARAVLTDDRLSRDPKRASDAREEVGLPRLSSERVASLLDMDPPAHTALRKVVTPEFTARRIERLRPFVERRTEELVDSFVERGGADLSADYAQPLTMSVLCEFVGLPVAEADRYRGWLAAVHQPMFTSQERLFEITSDMDAFFAELAATKRTERSDDVLGRLAALVEDDGGFDDEMLASMGRALIVGGFDSTKGLIVSGLFRLLCDPEQVRVLREDPERIPLAVEEFLRHDPPFTRLQPRYALSDVEVAGVAIAQGQLVSVDARAANRDPERFNHPDSVDVADVDRGHLAFGHGVHHCVGAALARLEADIAVRTVLSRFPGMALACDPEEIEWPIGVMTSPGSLPVKFPTVA